MERIGKYPAVLKWIFELFFIHLATMVIYQDRVFDFFDSYGYQILYPD
jgi:hypothetical protein